MWRRSMLIVRDHLDNFGKCLAEMSCNLLVLNTISSAYKKWSPVRQTFKK